VRRPRCRPTSCSCASAIIRAHPGLEASAKDILATHYGGYLLKVPAESVDVHRYEQLVDAGNRAIRSGEYETGASLIRSALDIWRGIAMVTCSTDCACRDR